MDLPIMLIGVSVCDIILITPQLSKPSDIVYLDKGITISLGGHPCNIGIDLAKLGYNPNRIFVVSAIGDDFCGLFIEKQLIDFGLQPILFRVFDVGSTKNVILVINGEDRRFHVDVGASIYLPLDYIIKALINIKPRLIHIAPGLLGEVDSNLAMVLRHAQNLGAITFVDVGAAKPFGKTDWRFLEESLFYTDIFHCNTYELKSIFNTDNIIDGIKKVLGRGVGIVLVTDGERGAYIAKDNYAIHQKAFSVEVVDPTGAGDAFQAGFIYRFVEIFKDKLDRKTIENMDKDVLVDLLIYAQAVGAICVTQPGATTAISRENVEKLLDVQRHNVLKSTVYIKL